MIPKKIVLQGLLYDNKSSFMRGPSEAPPAIRTILNNGSANFFTENGIDLGNHPFKDRGDFTIDEYIEIEEITIKNIEKGIPLLTLGGDHSVTYPVIKAMVNSQPSIDILHFDAHADIYDEFEGDKYSHACPFARIMEEELAVNLTQVGIRTLNTHQRDQAIKYNVDIREAKNLKTDDLIHFENPLYISLDMDVFDPAFAPGVSHHEPGGLTSRQVFDIIQQIESPIIGADIVEYNPRRDSNDITGALAAKLLKEIWGKMIANS
jgi:agmatinase